MILKLQAMGAILLLFSIAIINFTEPKTKSDLIGRIMMLVGASLVTVGFIYVILG